MVDINIFESKPGHYTHTVRLMGNQFSFTVVHRDKSQAMMAIRPGVQEVQRVEKMLTTFSESSETTLINANAGIRDVRVSKEVFDLINRCIQISALTQGAFDITYGSVHKDFWNFNTKMRALPIEETLK